MFSGTPDVSGTLSLRDAFSAQKRLKIHEPIHGTFQLLQSFLVFFMEHFSFSGAPRCSRSTWVLLYGLLGVTTCPWISSSLMRFDDSNSDSCEPPYGSV